MWFNKLEETCENWTLEEECRKLFMMPPTCMLIISRWLQPRSRYQGWLKDSLAFVPLLRNADHRGSFQWSFCCCTHRTFCEMCHNITEKPCVYYRKCNNNVQISDWLAITACSLAEQKKPGYLCCIRQYLMLLRKIENNTEVMMQLNSLLHGVIPDEILRINVLKSLLFSRSTGVRSRGENTVLYFSNSWNEPTMVS